MLKGQWPAKRASPRACSWPDTAQQFPAAAPRNRKSHWGYSRACCIGPASVSGAKGAEVFLIFDEAADCGGHGGLIEFTLAKHDQSVGPIERFGDLGSL